MHVKKNLSFWQTEIYRNFETFIRTINRSCHFKEDISILEELLWTIFSVFHERLVSQPYLALSLRLSHYRMRQKQNWHLAIRGKIMIFIFGRTICILRVLVTTCMSCEASLERACFMTVIFLTKSEFQLYFYDSVRDSVRMRNNQEQTTAKKVRNFEKYYLYILVCVGHPSVDWSIAWPHHLVIFSKCAE